MIIPWYRLCQINHEASVASIAAYFRQFQIANGSIIDPIANQEIQYATPCYAQSAATLIGSGYSNEYERYFTQFKIQLYAICNIYHSTGLLESAALALDSALQELATGTCAWGHSNFFTMPSMWAYDILKVSIWLCSHSSCVCVFFFPCWDCNISSHDRHALTPPVWQTGRNGHPPFPPPYLSKSRSHSNSYSHLVLTLSHPMSTCSRLVQHYINLNSNWGIVASGGEWLRYLRGFNGNLTFVLTPFFSLASLSLSFVYMHDAFHLYLSVSLLIGSRRSTTRST